MRARFVGRMSVLLALGCGSSAKDTGAPHLVSFLAQVPGAPDVDLVLPPDGGASAVSGVAQFKLVFDKLLDGDKIEAVGTGVQPKTDVISITWTGAPAGAPAITANTLYDPSGAASITTPAPKILLSPSPGLPSGAQLVIKLDRTKITSKGNTPLAGEDTFNLATQPFAVSTDLMPGQVATPDLTVHLSFTNALDPMVASHIRVTAAGAPVAVDVMPDPMDSRNRLVTAKAWPVGQALVLTVDKEAADLFGVKLPEDFSVMFSVQSGDGGAPDGGAVPDGGEAFDAGGAPDGAPSVDATAAPDAALDAGSDGAGDDATAG
jgi:hypothetical protein